MEVYIFSKKKIVKQKKEDNIPVTLSFNVCSLTLSFNVRSLTNLKTNKKKQKKLDTRPFLYPGFLFSCIRTKLVGGKSSFVNLVFFLFVQCHRATISTETIHFHNKKVEQVYRRFQIICKGRWSSLTVASRIESRGNIN